MSCMRRGAAAAHALSLSPSPSRGIYMNSPRWTWTTTFFVFFTTLLGNWLIVEHETPKRLVTQRLPERVFAGTVTHRTDVPNDQTGRASTRRVPTKVSE